MRVLMIGGGERYHLEPLARCIKKANPAVWLGVNDLNEPKAGSKNILVADSPYFDAIYQSPGKFREHVDNGAGPKDAAALCWSAEAPWKVALDATWRLFKRRAAKKKTSDHFQRISQGIDLLHLQSLFVGAPARWLLSTGKRGYFVSIWGSDMLRRSGVDEFIIQKTLLQRAGLISASTPELKEILLAKYGRELETKLITTFFNPEIDQIDGYLRPHGEISAAGVGRPFRVCIGHNGFEGGNHDRLLSGFANLTEAQKSRIELILPLTYGGSSAYRARIIEAATLSGCRVRLLDAFLSDDQIRRLRAEVDILVFAPSSDALSATVTQALACSSSVICGAWLSYRARARAGFKYREIEVPEDAANEVISIIDGWSHEVPHLMKNRELAFRHFSEKTIGQGWVFAYEKAFDLLNVK